MKMIFWFLRRFFHKRARLYHLLAFLRYNSLRKFANFLLNEFERLTLAGKLRSLPYVLYLEATNRCNFACPYCPTGKKFERAKGSEPAALADRLITQLSRSLYLTTFHGWGEPLLDPEIGWIVASFHKARVLTMLSTNGSLLDESHARTLISSGLDYLVVAIDGASSSTYERYRVNGKFDMVLSNLKRFMEIRREMKSRTPYVEWQFVVFKHNEHEMKRAEQLSREIGVDFIEFIPGYTENPEDITQNTRYKPRVSPLSRRSDCKSLWSTPAVLWNGDIAPCCWDYYGDSGFGNVLEQDFRVIWNSDKYVQSRRLIKEGPDKVNPDTICYYCVRNINKASPSILEHDMKSGVNK